MKPCDVIVMLNRIKTARLLIEKNASAQKALARDRDVFRGIDRSDLGYDLQKFTPVSSAC